MRKYRILIAEDTLEARDIIINEINKITDIDFEIVECESFTKAQAKIIESGKAKNYFDFLFIDIDFTEDYKGGKRDSGFKLIENAFEICPVSKIATYSAQYKAADLSQQHQDLVRKGLSVYTFDKDHRGENQEEWFLKPFRNLIRETNKNYFIVDIWKNHNSIVEKLKSGVYFEGLDDISKTSKVMEIVSNLDTIIVLLQNRNNLNSDTILNRLIIQLYHSALEVITRGGKTEEEIMKSSEINKSDAAKIIAKNEEWNLGDRVSALRSILAFDMQFFEFGYRLNDYRNKSVHPSSKFSPEILNVLFANLTLTLYSGVRKGNIETANLEAEIFSQKITKGESDLRKIINYIIR